MEGGSGKTTDAQDSDNTSGAKMPRKRKNRARRGYKGGAKHKKMTKKGNHGGMSYEQKKSLEELECQAYLEERQRRGAAGIPLSPMNSTQYIMEEHYKNEDFSTPKFSEHVSDESGSCTSSTTEVAAAAAAASAKSDDDFLAKDFAEQYENIERERLESMHKEKLVNEYLELTRRLGLVETENARLQNTSKEKMKTKEQEIEQLRNDKLHLQLDNSRLISENFELRHKLKLDSSSRVRLAGDLITTNSQNIF